MGEDTFQSALSNFVSDFASGGAIRHLADLGYTVTEIMEKLSFPTPKEKVAREVWARYLETGKICMEKPQAGAMLQKVRYVKEQNAYGTMSLRRVTEEIPMPEVQYIACEFGRMLYRDRESILKRAEALSKREREYLLDLPWPFETVYVSEKEPAKGIIEKLRISGLEN